MPYFFGSGRQHLPEVVDRVARSLGADLVNYTDPGCSCGHGCPRNCPANARHWFEVPDRGYPFNDCKAREVLNAIAICIQAT